MNETLTDFSWGFSLVSVQLNKDQSNLFKALNLFPKRSKMGRIFGGERLCQSQESK